MAQKPQYHSLIYIYIYIYWAYYHQFQLWAPCQQKGDFIFDPRLALPRGTTGTDVPRSARSAPSARVARVDAFCSQDDCHQELSSPR